MCLKLVRYLIAVAAVLPAGLWAGVLEDYGQIADMRSVTISPDGKHYAFIKRGHDGGETFYVIDAQTGQAVGSANASELKARNVYFATNDHVILRVSQTERFSRFLAKWEHGSAIAYNFKSNKFKGLLVEQKEIHPVLSGLSRIVGVHVETNEVYMPAFVGALRNSDPPRHLMRVNLDTGRGRILARGNHGTVDWFVSERGQVLARTDFDQPDKEFRVYSYLTGKPKLIFKQDTLIPNSSFLATDASNKHLVYRDSSEQGAGIYKLSLVDGSRSGPEFLQTDRDIVFVISQGLNREFMGVRISGPRPSYRYLDPAIERKVNRVVDRFPASSVSPVAATADLSQAIFSVSGNAMATGYLLVDATSDAMSWVGRSYPNVDVEHIGEIIAIEYSARDGQKIPAILTLPVGVEEPEKLPLLVFPHGGPEAFDSIAFNWWAQYFARQGYLVLQPNFRGSTGFGQKFRDAGRGQWGQLMQDDITDGVHALVEQGWADGERVCIMGASYGGYAALAGGAFTPELYRCVVSVAGVSDVLQMIKNQRQRTGRGRWLLSYWEKLIGDSKEDRDLLKRISPLNHAQQFASPVLLLHGKDDIVVPIRQSRRMHNALRKAGKQVEFITMQGEDHWLSRSATRLAMLREIDNFLKIHNPAG